MFKKTILLAVIAASACLNLWQLDRYQRLQVDYQHGLTAIKEAEMAKAALANRPKGPTALSDSDFYSGRFAPKQQIQASGRPRSGYVDKEWSRQSSCELEQQRLHPEATSLEVQSWCTDSRLK